jgi:hypothetical protein
MFLVVNKEFIYRKQHAVAGSPSRTRWCDCIVASDYEP